MTTGYGNAVLSQVELAKTFSSTRLLGPAMSADLVALVVHLFTPEEAAVARHLPFVIPKPARTIARRARRDPGTVIPLLAAMNEKRVIFRLGDRYSLLPLIPGMFEYIMIKGHDDDWTRTYAALFGKLFNSGYMRRYTRFRSSLPSVNYVPVNSRVDNSNRIVSDDFLARAVAHHDDIAVMNICQCRYHHRLLNEACEYGADHRDGCIWFGRFARWAIEDGTARRMSKEEVNRHIARGKEKNLVFLTVNIAPESDLMVCMCCRCCCHVMKSINEFNAGSIVAPPRYKAHVDSTLCNNCGKCAGICHTGAHALEEKAHRFFPEKCIGCGVCVEPCAAGAIRLMENPAYRERPRDLNRLLIRLLPAALSNTLKTNLYERFRINSPTRKD